MTISSLAFGAITVSAAATALALSTRLAPEEAGFLLLVPLVLAAWTPRAQCAYWPAAAGTLILLLTSIVSIGPPPASGAAVHRGMLVAAFWIVAAGIVHYRSTTANRDLDVTARRRAEDALETADKALLDLKRALDQSAIVATTNVRGDITYINDKFCDISGYSRDELLGANHRILNSGLHPIEFFKDMYATIGRGQVWRGEIRNRAKNGAYYWVDTTIVPFLDSRQRPYQYIAIRYDITERKRSEAALRDQASLAQLGKMAAVVAHEVRNPLAGMRGALQVITKRLPESGQERVIVHEVIARIDALGEIVQDLLVFARPTQPVLAPVPVGAIVSDTIALFKQDPVVADVEISSSGADAVVTADAGQLKMVLLNLLTNSAQAMQSKGRIAIETRRDHACVQISLADSGPGIRPDVREHLFEPFFTTRHRGTGLGLVTARRLIEAHGGTLRLDCPPEGGTVAIITLPAR